MSAVAFNIGSLIAFRALQGIGGGLIFSLMQTLAVHHARAAGGSLARITAIVSAPISLGPILGPVLGGVILHWAGWRWLFVINLPVCAVGIVLAAKFLPADSRRGHTPTFDALGLALLAPGLVGVLFGLSRVAAHGSFMTTAVLLPLLLGLALLAAFVAWTARRRDGAIIDLRMLRTRDIRSTAPVFFLFGAVLYTAMFLLPLYWQSARAETVLAAAFLLIPQGVGSLVGRLLAGRLTDQLGARVVTVSAMVVIAAATVPFALADATTNTWWLEFALLVRGLALGAVLVPVMTAAYHGLEQDQVPHATMLTRICQQLGASFGVAVIAVVLQHAQDHQHTADAFSTSFWWTIAITALGAVFATLLPGPRAPAESG